VDNRMVALFIGSLEGPKPHALGRAKLSSTFKFQVPFGLQNETRNFHSSLPPFSRMQAPLVTKVLASGTGRISAFQLNFIFQLSLP